MEKVIARIEQLIGMISDRRIAAETIFDVVVRAIQTRGGRPGTMQAQCAPVAAQDVAATPSPSSNLEIEVCKPSRKPDETSNSSMSGSESGSDLTLLPDRFVGSSLRNRKSYEPLPQGFGDFYAAYPRKVSKPDAVRAWEKQAPPPADVLAALAWQIPAWEAEGRPLAKVPHPATWLNGRRWEDPQPEPARLPVSPASRAQMENLMAIAERGRHRDDAK